MEPVARATRPRLRTGPGQNHEEARAQLRGLPLTPSLRSPSSGRCFPLPQCPPWTLKGFLLRGPSTSSGILPLPWV